MNKRQKKKMIRKYGIKIWLVPGKPMLRPKEFIDENGNKYIQMPPFFWGPRAIRRGPCKRKETISVFKEDLL